MKVNEEALLAAKLAHLRFDGTRDAMRIAMDAAKLKSMARALHRLAETACERDLTDGERRRYGRLVAATKKLAKEYCIQRVNFNGDPRGYAVYLYFPDGRGNTWGGDETGWGI